MGHLIDFQTSPASARASYTYMKEAKVNMFTAPRRALRRAYTHQMPHLGVADDRDRSIGLLEVLDLLLRERHIESTCRPSPRSAFPTQVRHSALYSPRISSRFFRLVVPMMGADTPGFARIQAVAICAMLTPFFLDSSSTL